MFFLLLLLLSIFNPSPSSGCRSDLQSNLKAPVSGRLAEPVPFSLQAAPRQPVFRDFKNGSNSPPRKVSSAVALERLSDSSNLFLLSIIISASHQFSLGVVKLPHQVGNFSHDVLDDVVLHLRRLVEQDGNRVEEALVSLFNVSRGWPVVVEPRRRTISFLRDRRSLVLLIVSLMSRSLCFHTKRKTYKPTILLTASIRVHQG